MKIRILASPTRSAAHGWDDSARSLALRFHASVLRALSEMLHRRLWEGLPLVETSTFDAWLESLVLRRCECADAILGLRLEGRLGWQRDPPEPASR